MTMMIMMMRHAWLMEYSQFYIVRINSKKTTINEVIIHVAYLYLHTLYEYNIEGIYEYGIEGHTNPFV